MDPINSTCPWSGKPVNADAVTRHDGHLVGFCSTEHRDQFVKAVAHFAQSASPAVTTRAFDLARTGANVRETILTPAAVRARGVKRLFSLSVPGDARGCEAQPLIAPGLTLPGGAVHDVVFLATMANQVFAFDANDGKPLWQRALGQPINGSEDIDAHKINDHWGIISTPVIDLAAGVLYACAWISADGSWQKGQFWLHALRLADGSPARAPLNLEGATYTPGHGAPVQQFRSAERKQRAALALTGGAVLIPFGTIQETAATARGWLIAVDTKSWTISATWCSTARGSGGGIWHSGAGPAVDAAGFIYVVTGNGDFDGVTDFGESIIKLRYTPPATGRAGALAVVDWWTPWTDDGRTGGHPEGAAAMAVMRAKPRPSNFRLGPYLARMGLMPMGMASGEWSDQDFGSGGPVLAPGDTLLASGKDGILYTANTSSLGKTTPADLAPAKAAANYAKLKAPPVFYTYYPGPALSPEPGNVSSLNTYFAHCTHHLHGAPVLWQSNAQGLMHFCGGENGNLRAWRLNADGSSTYLACSAEVASPQAQTSGNSYGGMPGWMFSLSANGATDGIVWALVPAGDANMELTPGRLLAYDAANFGVYGDGSKQLVVLWDSWDWGAGCAFTHPKFNRPVAWNGKVFVPTYDGRVDVYGLA